MHERRARFQSKPRRTDSNTLRRAFEAAPEGLLVAEIDGRCIFANRVAATLLGRDLVDTDIHVWLHRELSSECPFEAAASGISKSAFLTGDQTKSGLRVHCTAAPVLDQERIEAVVMTFVRVAVDQRVEQIRRIDSLVRMAATIAHEFNNVLMGIQPFAEVIRRKGSGNESLLKAADHITNAVARGKRITQDILRISRSAEPQMRSVELIPWLEQLSSEIRALVGTGINVEFDAPAEGALFVRCDPDQMQQVLMNLAVNARDAMAGTGTLRIIAERAGQVIRTVVADNGCGMAADTLPYIFEPLFTTKRSGTGLGLAVAQQIVIRNGGTISVESEVGKGTRFWIEFPAAAPAEPELESREEPEISQLRVGRVLIVEDDPTVAEGLKLLLEASGGSVDVAGNGQAAIGAVLSHSYDIVILDIGLPDINGEQVYSAVRGSHPDLPIIVSTGHAHTLGETFRPDGHLQKPYEIEDLLHAIRDALNRANERMRR